MINTFNKVTLRNQHKYPRKIKPRRALLASNRSIKQDRPEKKLSESWLKITHFSLLSVIIFVITFYLTSFLPLSSISSPSLPLKTLHELNLLASKVSIFMQEETVKTEKIEQLLTREYEGVTRLSFIRSENVKLNATVTENYPEMFSQIGNKISFQIPVGKDGTHGILVISQDISTVGGIFFWIRSLISGSVVLLIVALLVFKQTRRITDQVDVLCRHFVKFRRENESGDLYPTETLDGRTLIGQRIAVLEELWTRFQSMQEELAQNVEELEDSKQKLEQTVTDLQVAKKKELRWLNLVTLWQNLGMTFVMQMVPFQVLPICS